jgi:nitrate reductase (NAD(P)H)
MTAQVVPSMAHTVQGAPAEESLVQGSEEWSMHVPATSVDAKDADTPDNWVPRDPRIQRLTGRHPLNCEPPMDVLMDYGFITPPSVHYVRNHGAVPNLDWANHRIEINGLVDRPVCISMDELLELPSVTIPVTLVCAGNRRKEENMIKKSIGRCRLFQCTRIFPHRLVVPQCHLLSVSRGRPSQVTKPQRALMRGI